MPPAPIQFDSIILEDSLYLYGVDYMSNQDILGYFRKYKDPNAPPLEDEPEDDDAMNVDQGNKYKKPREIPGEVKVEWIDDSSCVIKFVNKDLARSAYK